MTWTTPPTWANGATVTAAQLNNTIGHSASGSDLESSGVGIMTNPGDLFYSTGANALARLAVGTDGQFLSWPSGAAPAWVNKTQTARWLSGLVNPDASSRISNSVTIPSVTSGITYNNLLIEAMLATTDVAVDNEPLWFLVGNSGTPGTVDTGSNYDYTRHRISNNALSKTFEAFGTNHPEVADVVTSRNSSVWFTQVTIFIPQYANTSNNKIILAKYATKYNTGTDGIVFGTSVICWRSNSAINQIAFAASGVSFVNGCYLGVYLLG